MELHHDERILYSSSPSWKSQFGAHLLVVIGAILVGVVVVLAIDPDWIGIVAGIAVALVAAGVLWLKRSRTTYVVTTHRLRVREGFLAKEVQETRLDRIQNVTVNQSVPERILRIGTVDYDTAGNDADARFRMTGVQSPDALVRLVDRAQRESLDAERGKAAIAEAEADAAVRSRREAGGDRLDDPASYREDDPR
jgi:uncharacterized membrane protein YdbT with pleckstrin-like domain